MRHFYSNIYIGNQEDAGNTKEIREKNIKVIMNVASDRDTPHDPEVTLVKLGLDDPKFGLAHRNEVASAVSLFQDMRKVAEERGGNILIHCAAGHNRSALVAALWLTGNEKYSLSEAVKLAEVKDNKRWMKAKGYVW